MEKPATLQSEWNKLLNTLQIHFAQRHYHLLIIELKLAVAILQQESASQLLATFTEATIDLIKNCLIVVGQAADEKDYRDQFHKILLAQWHKILSNKNAKVAETFLKEIRHKAPSSIMVKPHYNFNHDFNALYVANSSAHPYQFLKCEQEDRLKRLEGDFERNRYVVYAEIVVTYVRCLIRARHNISNEHLATLGVFIESLSYIAVTQQTGHEELWHYLLPLQTDLADELIYAHYQSFMDPAHLLDWQQKQPHKTGESLLLLQTVVYTLSLSKDLSAQVLIEWLQRFHKFIDLVTQQPQAITCELLQTEQHKKTLAEYRKVFLDSDANFIQAQKNFSKNSLELLYKLTDQMAKLLGEKPCEWALCATGSSARLDRRPYSDVELMLLYQIKPNVFVSHLQTYLYFLLSGLEIAIKQLGETHYEYTQDANLTLNTAGFHLDSSCHILREELFGTPTEIIGKYFSKTFPRRKTPAEDQGDWHDWLHNRKFYAILFPVLICGNSHVLNVYQDKKAIFLKEEINESDQIERLIQTLPLPKFSQANLSRHHVIALSSLFNVLLTSKKQLQSLKKGDVVDLKDTFYKPLTYLAVNLKLYYGLKAEHPAEIYAEAAAKLPWGAREVVTLLQVALSYIGQLQVKLHLKHGYQEECCVWLEQDNDKQASSLTASEYAGLSLIKDGLLLPLCECLDKQFKDNFASFSLLDVLPYLLKKYLANRSEQWLRSWTKHATHRLCLTELLAHPMISVLVDYPSPNGWSPMYEQTMQRWLDQLQTLTSEHKTPCMIEGISTSSKQKTGYLPAEIVNQLFDAKGEFKGNVHHSAQSKVSQITWQIPGQDKPTTFYFKVKPGNKSGLMGREFAVINLHQLLGGKNHIALGWPLKLTYLTVQGPKIYYCWVSEGIPGNSLAEIMQNKQIFADLNFQFEMESYSHLFITHYLTCPEDAQPDNFKVVDNSDISKKILYGLDVGQSFVGTYEEKRKVLSVKTILYLVEPAIHQALDTVVLTRLMLLDPSALIKHWQSNLKHINKLFQPLFEIELSKAHVPKAQWSLHNQLIDLDELVQQAVKKRLDLLLNWLFQQPWKDKTGASLLKALEPALALSYQSLRGKIKRLEDFYKIDPKA